VLLLSPGIKGRVGPHRLYLSIAARLVPLGFHVLRFDYYGLGDSEGELSERALADMYNSIQAGRYIGDTIAAMDWMQRTLEIRRFVGSGLCGGSISALATAEVDRRIECLLGMGLPTVLEGGPENWARILTKHQIVSLRHRHDPPCQRSTEPIHALRPRSWPCLSQRDP
jgi:dienelactone hydrolase